MLLISLLALALALHAPPTTAHPTSNTRALYLDICRIGDTIDPFHPTLNAFRAAIPSTCAKLIPSNPLPAPLTTTHPFHIPMPDKNYKPQHPKIVVTTFNITGPAVSRDTCIDAFGAGEHWQEREWEQIRSHAVCKRVGDEALLVQGWECKLLGNGFKVEFGRRGAMAIV
jgi:hypothetical protein